jgi:hypothetical protein
VNKALQNPTAGAFCVLPDSFSKYWTGSDLFSSINFMTEVVEHPKSAQISSYLASNKRREFGPVGNVTLHS